jgi:hypothetical protein
MRIPMQRTIAAALARGLTLVEAFPDYLPRFQELYIQIQSLVSGQPVPAPQEMAGD